MEMLMSIVNMLILIGVSIGVYKNKIDISADSYEKVNDIDIRLTRLEEKVNYIYITIKENKN